jgi:hypothetical protein
LFCFRLIAFRVLWSPAVSLQSVMAFRPLRDSAIGPLIVSVVVVGWLLALALLIYVATSR